MTTQQQIDKPLITFALFAYNQEQYIEEAVLGAFSQTYTPLEIVLSDDCSSDNTFTIMEKMAKAYKGPHKIILNKNSKNLGLIGHVNKVFSEIANGEIIVVAAGDDISLPERVTQTWNAFNKDKNIMSVSMNYENIDIHGNVFKTRGFPNNKIYSLIDFSNNIDIPLLGCTRAYHKKIFDVFDLLDSNCGIEDSNLVFRSLLLGESFHLNEIGVKYRRMESSLSNKINFKEYNSTIQQRTKDVKNAKKNNLIDSNLYFKLLKTIEKSHKKNIQLDKVFNKKNKLLNYFSSILFNKNFKLKEKIRYFKTILKNVLLK